MSLDDREELSAFTGIDPLADDLEADEPLLMKFIKIAQQLKAASLKIVDLAYILHHNDITGKLTPSEDGTIHFRSCQIIVASKQYSYLFIKGR